MRTRTSARDLGLGALFTITGIGLAFPARVVADDSAKNQVSFGIEVARRGLWEEARFRFEQASKASPDSAAALNNLAVALEQQGEFEKAKAAYERALQLAPKNISIQQNYDLFREADEKRNKKKKDDKKPAASAPQGEPSPKPEAPKPAATVDPNKKGLR